jgi:outer membrane protein insertion porin family
VGRLHANLGYGGGYDGTSELPFYQNYFAGGFGSVRGYKDNELGPRSPSQAYVAAGQVDPDPEYVGGNILVEGGADLIFPTPFASDNKQIRTVWFVDSGNVFNSSLPGYNFSTGELRYTTGVSLSWLTAIGPLGFSLALPLNKKPGDETQVFQFSIGQGF